MTILDRLLMRPERAKGSRAQQTTERFRAAEYRLERDTMRDALQGFLGSISEARAEDVAARLAEAHRTAQHTLEWAEMREQSREISRDQIP